MKVAETAYYELLGLDPNALSGTSEDTKAIKKAFNIQARAYHPDKNPDPEATEKFQKISHAYEVLRDDAKREKYNLYGEAAFTGGGDGPGGGPGDIFSHIFGGGGVFPGGGMPRSKPKVRTIHHVHKVSLEDIYRGKVSKLALQRSIVCPTCSGRGGKEGAVKVCTSCDGHGMKTMMRQMGPMIQRFQTVCPDCNGEGEVMRDKDRCKDCRGKKTIVERKVLHVPIDRGVKDGHRIDFPGEGDQTPGLETGDVVFEIEQKPHERFQRKNDDLFYKVSIDLVTALAGGTIYIEHLDERWLSVEILPGEAVNPGSVKMIRGQGMPSFRHHDMGNMYIHFDVKFPDPQWTADPAVFEKLKEILPPSLPHNPPPETMTEVADLEDVDANEQARANGQAMEEDDDEQMGGEPRVQCASQ